LPIAAPGDQAGALEHVEVFGDRGLAHVERLGELHHRGFATGQRDEDRPSRRIGERGEYRVEVGFADHLIT